MGISGIVSKIAKSATIFNPAKNELCHSNTGLRKILYGKNNGYSYSPGLIHAKVASKYGYEIDRYLQCRNSCSDNAISVMSAVEKAIPEKYKKAFYECIDMPEVQSLPLVRHLSDIRAVVSKKYYKYIDKPIAKVHGFAYFTLNGLKENISGLFKKSPKIDKAYVERCLPSYMKRPENLTDENAKEILTEVLRNANWSEKEIKNALKGKMPKFYRFVSETELRALKNGAKMKSTASYHENSGYTDITSNPNYNFNMYRLTFKRNPKWNPYIEKSKILPHDLSSKKWYLTLGYDKHDVACFERVS